MKTNTAKSLIRTALLQVIIKDYQENEGVYDILFAANVVSKVKRRISVGLHKAYVCDLLIKPKFKYVR